MNPLRVGDKIRYMPQNSHSRLLPIRTVTRVDGSKVYFEHNGGRQSDPLPASWFELIEAAPVAPTRFWVQLKGPAFRNHQFGTYSLTVDSEDDVIFLPDGRLQVNTAELPHRIDPDRVIPAKKHFFRAGSWDQVTMMVAKVTR